MKTRNKCVWSGSLIALILLVPAILLGRFHWLDSPRGFVTKESPTKASKTLPFNAKSKAIGDYRKLPLSFEPNVGQTDSRVRFLSRGDGYGLFLTQQEVVLVLAPVASRQPSISRSKRARFLRLRQQQSEPTSTASPDGISPSVLRMNFKGTNQTSRILGLDKLPGKTSYFIGNDPTKWRTDVPTYARFQYEGIYPGVDLTFYGYQQQLEFDLSLKPGAAPQAI